MSKNILIGVGGTGAKVVEAMLHLSATGIGPAAMDVGFIDQDKANGNVARAADLLNLMVRTHTHWRTEAALHQLPRGEVAPLFRTKLEPLHASDNLWVPDPEGRSTLAGMFGELRDDKMLFDTLFTAEEQDMVLDGGYRGKPHLGSTAITAHSNDDRGFWRSLVEKVKAAQTGREVRLLLTGSVFGGTGAAGFPTVARLIRQKLKDARIKGNVSIGGILMLPYFTFQDPGEEGREGEDAADVAMANELLIQSRGALRHYQWQLEQSQLFDALYFVGWDDPFHLNYHAPDAGRQENPALLPELLAATAGYRFLTAEQTVEKENVQPLLISARRAKNAISWSDFPPHNPASPDELYVRVAQFLRFAAGLKAWRPHFADQDARSRAAKQPWYRCQELDTVDWENGPPTAELVALGDVVDRFLRWAGSIQAYASREDSDFQFALWNLAGLVTTADFDNPAQLLAAHAALSSEEFAPTFGRIAVHDAHGDDPIGSAAIADWLSNKVAAGDHAGLGTFISSLHAFSNPRTGPYSE